MEKLGTIDYSDIILDASKIGRWVYEIDKGKSPRMYIDDVMANIMGLNKDLTPEDLYTYWYSKVNPEEIDCLRKCIDVLKSGEYAEVTYNWQHPTKGYILVRCGGQSNNQYTAGNRIEGYTRDITGTKRYCKEDELIENQYRNLEVISGLSDDFGCVVYVDVETGEEIHYRRDPLFEELIPGWGDLPKFSMRLQTLAGTIMHPDDRKAFLKATEEKIVRARIRKTGTHYVNFRILVNDEVIYYQLKFVAAPDTFNHVIAGIRNVDVETKRELEALEKAEQASNAKTNFLSNMSHDIRTPMNAIIGFTEVAIKNIDNKEKVLDSLNKAKTSSEHLLSLINDILDMTRIESGKVELDEKPANIIEAFNSGIPMLQNLADNKGVILEHNIGTIRDPYIYADYLRLNQVLINVVSNAVKYTDPGGTVSFSMSQLDEEWNHMNVYLFVVQDTGIGMSKEYISHMFETFSRERTSTVSGKEGTGLGLAITKSIVDLMGGAIDVESAPNSGSKFTITIPFKVQTGDVIADRDNKDAQVDSNIRGKKILLVEDNEFNREIAAELLIEAGLSVEEADDGTKAIAMIKEKGPEYYDAVLMDIQMPYMNGYEATAEIRKMYPACHIPIIALSANAFEEDRKRSLAAGMDDHQAKPIVMSELFESLKRLIK